MSGKELYLLGAAASFVLYIVQALQELKRVGLRDIYIALVIAVFSWVGAAIGIYSIIEYGQKQRRKRARALQLRQCANGGI